MLFEQWQGTTFYIYWIKHAHWQTALFLLLQCCFFDCFSPIARFSTRRGTTEEPQKNLHPVCHFRYRQKEQLHSHLIQAIQTKQKNPQLSPGSSQSQLQKMNFNNLCWTPQVIEGITALVYRWAIAPNF